MSTPHDDLFRDFSRPTGSTLVTGAAPPATLRVGPAAEWFHLPDTRRVSLATRAVLRRLLWALVCSHDSGVPLTADQLAAAVWPGETLLPKSRANRLAVALSTLRTMGLRELLIHVRGGWYLSSACRIVVVSEPAEPHSLQA